jgi:aldehyde:ferredoxin oxidoreductase
MNGYAGKILRVDLTARKLSTIETAKYAHWIGGHGIGSAIFWDLVKDKKISGFDPANVITIMTSPLTGTLAPGGSSRTEVQGIGVQSWPIEWFTRSNVGGRFGPMLKFAGWDGLVIEGRADKPVWVDIRDSEVKIRDAGHLWGLDAWETQQRIWRDLGVSNGWLELGDPMEVGRTTQKPAILTIGPCGEKKSRLGALIHDAGNGAGQGGFGGVWGSKNLKAISVIGTGAIEVADPKALLEARLWAKKNYMLDISDPSNIDASHSLAKNISKRSMNTLGTPPTPAGVYGRPERSRPQSCMGCVAGCRTRNATGIGNESACVETAFYKSHVLMRKARGKETGSLSLGALKATDLCQRLGINAYELFIGIFYLQKLFKKGELGPGKRIDCDLKFQEIGSYEFIERLLHMIAYREGLGDDIAEGFARAAERWGRVEEDLRTGLLRYPNWGLPQHYEPRTNIEWALATILGDRDVNAHGLSVPFYAVTTPILQGKKPILPAQELVEIFAEKMVPYQGDTRMLDFSHENVYSEHFAKFIAWHLHYSRFWSNSVLYCDFLFPDFINPSREDKRGAVGEAEQKFLNAVTGADFDFVQGMEMGRKIWNLDNAIWTLQGRHRDLAHFAEYIYQESIFFPCYLPCRTNGKWRYARINGQSIDREKFEEFKTRFYKLEGWDTKTGWPQRDTLKSLGLDHVADELQKNDRLGRG